MRFLSEEQRGARAEGFLSRVSFLAGEPSESAEPYALSEVSRKVLIKAALEYWQPLLAVYESLGLHGAEGKRAVDDLIARGFIRLHRLARLGRGGMPTVIEVLSDGRTELSMLGISPTPLPVRRGGFRHGLYAYFQGQWASGKGYRSCFEKTLGGKAFDFVFEREGELIAIENYLSGTVDYAARQTLKGAQVKGIKRVIVACERKSFLQEILRRVGQLDELGLFKEKIEGKMLAEFVP